MIILRSSPFSLCVHSDPELLINVTLTFNLLLHVIFSQALSWLLDRQALGRVESRQLLAAFDVQCGHRTTIPSSDARQVAYMVCKPTPLERSISRHQCITANIC
jgi:hypothetical protein